MKALAEALAAHRASEAEDAETARSLDDLANSISGLIQRTVWLTAVGVYVGITLGNLTAHLLGWR